MLTSMSYRYVVMWCEIDNTGNDIWLLFIASLCQSG